MQHRNTTERRQLFSIRNMKFKAEKVLIPVRWKTETKNCTNYHHHKISQSSTSSRWNNLKFAFINCLNYSLSWDIIILAKPFHHCNHFSPVYKAKLLFTSQTYLQNLTHSYLAISFDSNSSSIVISHQCHLSISPYLYQPCWSLDSVHKFPFLSLLWLSILKFKVNYNYNCFWYQNVYKVWIKIWYILKICTRYIIAPYEMKTEWKWTDWWLIYKIITSLYKWRWSANLACSYSSCAFTFLAAAFSFLSAVTCFFCSGVNWSRFSLVSLFFFSLLSCFATIF